MKLRGLLTTIVLAASALLPIVFDRSVTASFRLPKELLLRAEAIVIVAAAFVAWIGGVGFPSRERFRDRALVIPAIAFVAFVIVTLTSTKPALSHVALATAAAAFVIYLGTFAAASFSDASIVMVPLFVAVMNALLVLIEELGLWMPFGENPAVPHHLQCSALIGNPNEVGSYLCLATLAAAAVVSTRPTRGNKVLLTILAAALVGSRTLSGIIACAAGVLAMVAIGSLRRAVKLAAAMLLAAIVIVICVAPFRERAKAMAVSIRTANYNELSTERLVPFAAAWAMFLDHPLTGVGPGAFAWHYYDYKLEVEKQHPALRHGFNRGMNYGEVHNDHLQVLAEGGVIGYAAYVAVLVAIGSLSFVPRVRTLSQRAQFARNLAFPLAVGCALLSLPQFPLETAIVRGVLIHFGAVIAAWRHA